MEVERERIVKEHIVEMNQQTRTLKGMIQAINQSIREEENLTRNL